MNVLRKLLQKEVYGVAGVFFSTFDISHSTSFVSKNATNKKIDNLRKEGFEPRYTYDGKLFKSKSKKNHAKQRGLYLPESILRNFEESIDDEERLFVKDIESESLDVLEYMFRRSLELRGKHGNNWYPIFSNKSIVRDTGIGLETVTNSTNDLTGIICESYMMKTWRVWQKRYCLPSSKFEDVRNLLE